MLFFLTKCISASKCPGAVLSELKEGVGRGSDARWAALLFSNSAGGVSSQVSSSRCASSSNQSLRSGVKMPLPFSGSGGEQLLVFVFRDTSHGLT